MPTTVKLKNSVTSTNVPSSLVQGEVAVNVTDKKVWIGNAASSPVQILGAGASLNGMPIGATTASTGAFSTLSATGVTTVQAGTAAAPAITTTGDTNTGIFFPAADTIAFTEGGVESMRINASGDVGIGTASPQARFQVDSSSTTYSANIRARNSNFGSGIIGAASGILTVATDMNNLAFYTASNLGVDGTSVPTNERMRIASTGDVMIGTTSANGKVTINQTDTGARTITASSPVSYASTAFRSDSAATSGTGWYHLYGSSGAGSVNNIFIYGNGNIENANNSYGAISDIKVKENIVDATPKLDKLMQVKVRNYNLKGEYDQHKQIGVIAQELETIFPSLIEETQDRGENDEVLETTTKSVKYSVFVPMLIKAMQEQQTMITELKATVDAQAARIAVLENPSVAE